ncbi:hypothetical protein [Acrocarpospora macrocephala]|uniref:hypothetical protein n=1 Tax=Acrocarpospora macrocephala TaxID=150177 RepID=UPI0012D3635D|nr:hypothetical protein [Acrocarpospora macrocephala]
MIAWSGNTGECLAVKPHPGNAGSNTVADHVEVLAAAIAQIPPKYRRQILITCDGTGATIELPQFITTFNARSRRAHYSLGFGLDQRARTAIAALPELVWAYVLDDQEKPPRQLALGSAGYDAVVDKLQGILADIRARKDVSRGADSRMRR